MFFKIGFLEISQYLRENICVESLYNKVTGLSTRVFLWIFFSHLNQMQCGMVSTKGRSGYSTGYLHIISRNQHAFID